MEVEYLDGIFDITYRKFLNAIDHIEYHPSFQDKAESVRNEDPQSLIKWDTINLMIMF